MIGSACHVTSEDMSTTEDISAMVQPFDSCAKAPPAKRWEKGYGDENDFVVIVPTTESLFKFKFKFYYFTLFTDEILFNIT